MADDFMADDRAQLTQLLHRAQAGDRGALDRALVVLYDDLRHVADRYFAAEPADHTLQPTALIHESFLRLIDQRQTTWVNRGHFLALASTTMRRVLTDHARAKLRLKRGGTSRRVPLDTEHPLSLDSSEDILAVHEALERLEKLDPRQARIVELRFFGGMTVPEVAEELGVSARTVEAEWTMIRAWLRRELGSDLQANTAE
jgi:RNA polymerase sigma-70 factor, ECF subfamily